MTKQKVGIVGDVHGSKWWKQHFEKINELDKIVVLGDMMDNWVNDWINENQINNLQEIIDWKKKYEDKITLLVGNHDKLVKAGGVFESVEMLKNINDYGKNFWLCHYPLMTWHKMRSGAIMLHGHMHNKKEYNIENKRKHILRYDVGVDANNYYPISTKEILEFFGEEALNNPFNNHHEKNIIEKIKYFFFK